MLREATRYDIPVADYFGIVAHEASNPSKSLAFAAALFLEEDKTIGLTEVQVSTAEYLIQKKKNLPGPTNRTQLVLLLGLDNSYSIRAGAAAHRSALDTAKRRLPNLSEGLRRYYALSIYNIGEARTFKVVNERGVGAFDPAAVRYISIVKQCSPGAGEVQVWALASNMATC